MMCILKHVPGIKKRKTELAVVLFPLISLFFNLQFVSLLLLADFIALDILTFFFKRTDPFTNLMKAIDPFPE